MNQPVKPDAEGFDAAQAGFLMRGDVIPLSITTVCLLPVLDLIEQHLFMFKVNTSTLLVLI